jgi:tRNA threonylcarbamoyladenosine biosynthesis protein TsaE
MPISYHLKGLSQTKALVSNLLDEGYKHFALEGDLGSGKTTLVQQAGAILDIQEAMPSPTFMLMAAYQTTDNPFYHFDLYRLNDDEQALDAGLEEYWEHPDAYVFIEWPNIVKSILPERFLWLNLTYVDAETREITVYC